jgi:hypothetical protein
MAAPGAAQPMTTPGTPYRPTAATPGSGSTIPPVDLPTEQRIRNRLAADGYYDVSNLQRDIGGYTAKAVKDGKVVDVMVDDEGKVMRMR